MLHYNPAPLASPLLHISVQANPSSLHPPTPRYLGRAHRADQGRSPSVLVGLGLQVSMLTAWRHSHSCHQMSLCCSYLSPFFLFMNPLFHCPCTVLSPPKLLPNKHSACVTLPHCHQLWGFTHTTLTITRYHWSSHFTSFPPMCGDPHGAPQGPGGAAEHMCCEAVYFQQWLFSLEVLLYAHIPLVNQVPTAQCLRLSVG